MKKPTCHAEQSEAERNEVEESRGKTFKTTQRDPSAPLGMTAL
jgi:hypothetical protein